MIVPIIVFSPTDQRQTSIRCEYEQEQRIAFHALLAGNIKWRPFTLLKVRLEEHHKLIVYVETTKSNMTNHVKRGKGDGHHCYWTKLE